jgi:SAM-dependent methyltransferase
MIRAAARRNARAVAAGRVAVRPADVAHLPFDDARFDKVFGVHTVYFWPDVAGAVAEIARVLAPRGRVALTLAPGRVGLPDDEEARALVEERLLPAMRRAGLAAARVVRGPDSRQFRTVAVVGER